MVLAYFVLKHQWVIAGTGMHSFNYCFWM